MNWFRLNCSNAWGAICCFCLAANALSQRSDASDDISHTYNAEANHYSNRWRQVHHCIQTKRNNLISTANTHRARQSEIGSGLTESSRKTENNSVVFLFCFRFSFWNYVVAASTNKASQRQKIWKGVGKHCVRTWKIIIESHSFECHKMTVREDEQSMNKTKKTKW